MTEARDLQELFRECMPLFIVLGDEVRLTIIEALTSAGLYDNRGLDVAENLSGYDSSGKYGLNVKEITEKTSLSRPAISHHLKLLKDAGLVNVRKVGTSNYYYLTIADGTRMLKSLSVQLQQLLNNT